MTFLNNVVPWNANDGCMNWTWYLANEFQFFCILPWLVETYYMRRRLFWYSIATLWSLCSILTLLAIFHNDLSASYFSYKNEYWTIFYEKPYARLPGYLVGVIWGCSYFTFKHEQQGSAGVIRNHGRNDDDPSNVSGRDPEPNPIIAVFDKAQKSPIWGITAVVGGWTFKSILVLLLLRINMV